MEQSKNRDTLFKLVIVCLGILLVGSFWLTVKGSSDPVSMAVVPQAPREGEPILATFKLNNPSSQPLVTNYQFYANGKLLQEGAATIVPDSSKTYQYAYENPLPIGERLNFMVSTQSERGNYEKIVSTPPYPPQIWSSFISFASLSTSVMSSMSTMTYYQSAFGSDVGLSVGLIASIVLIILLIFLELTQPVIGARIDSKMSATLGSLRIRFSTITWILLIIFMGIVYTRVAIILAT